MTLKNFLTINAIMFIPFGIAMLTVPSFLFPMLAVHLEADGLVIASTVGSMLLSFGVICWLARDVAGPSPELRAILTGNLLFHSIDSFLTGKAAVLGVMNMAGFLFSSMHFLFAIGFLFYLRKLHQAS